MGIKTGAKDRLRIAGLFMYLTAKYFITILLVGIGSLAIIQGKGCGNNTSECFGFILSGFAIWIILGIIEWILYGKIVWKYEIKSEKE